MIARYDYYLLYQTDKGQVRGENRGSKYTSAYNLELYNNHIIYYVILIFKLCMFILVMIKKYI